MHKRTVLITGGASGIGYAVANFCANRNWNVVILDADVLGVERAVTRLSQVNSGTILGLPCDVTKEGEVSAAFERTVQEFPHLSGVFANAGIGTGGGWVHTMDLETWDKVLWTNLTGVFLTCKYALQSMLSHRVSGSIVCTSSPSAFVAQSMGGVPAYSASKAGISALVRCMAIDYAAYGIRINAVVPGATDTALMWSNVSADERTILESRINAEIPLGRMGQPQDIAEAVGWLLSDSARYVTGSHLVCDGGLLAKASYSV